MPIVLVYPRAEGGQFAIGTHTLETWGVNQAARYLGGLESCYLQLADTPLLVLAVGAG